MQAYERLKQIVDSAEEDISKAEGGNKAAGTRARKTMQDVKAAAQEVRSAILELRDQGGGDQGSGQSPPPAGGLGGMS